MLRIGFTEKYFTLWDVTSTDTYYTDIHGAHHKSGVRTQYTYKQNLSMVEEKAIKKASDRGVTDLSVDTDLRGQRGSFTRYQSIPIVKEEIEPTKFQFGKYSYTLVGENEDLDYLKWYYGQQPTFSLTDTDCPKHNMIVASRMIELDNDYRIHNGELMTEEEVNNIRKYEENVESLNKYGYHIAFVERNVNDYGMLFVDGIQFYFPTVRAQYYRDIEYFLPVINGKAKRIKNKRVKIYSEQVVPDPYAVGTCNLVSNFEIIN